MLWCLVIRRRLLGMSCSYCPSPYNFCCSSYCYCIQRKSQTNFWQKLNSLQLRPFLSLIQVYFLWDMSTLVGLFFDLQSLEPTNRINVSLSSSSLLTPVPICRSGDGWSGGLRKIWTNLMLHIWMTQETFQVKCVQCDHLQIIMYTRWWALNSTCTQLQ